MARSLEAAAHVFPTPLDNVHMIAVPTPWAVGDVNVYLVEDDPLTLIDTGPKTDEALAALESGLAVLGVGVADIQRVIVTHAHLDHYGLAGHIVAQSGAEVLTHPLNVIHLSDPPGARRERDEFFGKLYRANGVPEDVVKVIGAMSRSVDQFADPVPVGVAGALVDGEVVSIGGLDWDVLHTPGHAGGLVCFYNAERRLLFSNDHLLAQVSSNPITEPPDAPGQKRPRRLAQYMEQLERVAAYDVDMALPGHGEFISDHRAIIAGRLEMHAKRADKIYGMLADGRQTLYQLTKTMFPKLEIQWMFLGLSEVLGHIDLLEIDGRVGRDREDGLTYFRRTR